MFWFRTFLNIRFINAISALFYLSRGLDLSQMIYLGVWWGLGAFLFEIPSSYLADRWGRKKTIILSVVIGFSYMTILFFGYGFIAMAFASFIYGVMSAGLSGTDIAVVYDTNKELGREGESMSVIGKYHSAFNMTKIFSVALGAYIAKDLTDFQFQIVLLLDIIFLVLAGIIAMTITEPRHTMDLEKQEAGIFLDAIKLLRENPSLLKGILNREVLWSGFFMVWAYFQSFFFDLGVSVITLGILWSVHHAINFALKRRMHTWAPNMHIAKKIYIINAIFVFGLAALIVGWFAALPGILLYSIYCFAMGCPNGIRRVLFETYFNSYSNSFNRATTLSLTNFVHNIGEIILMGIGGVVVMISPIGPYILLFILGLGTLTFLRIPHEISAST